MDDTTVLGELDCIHMHGVYLRGTTVHTSCFVAG